MEGPFSNDYADIYYDPKDPTNLWDLQNRQQFLRAAAQHVPRFADSLFEMTCPLIREWFDRHGSLPKQASPDYRKFYSQVFAAIRDWARGFNIEVGWVVEEAWTIVVVAIGYANKGIDPLTAFGTWWRKTHPGGDTRAFLLPAWNPREESQTAYAVRANKAWKQLRDEYITATKIELEKAGLEAVPKRRKRQFPEELRFEWAVLHKCEGTPIEELADKYREELKPSEFRSRAF
jgi:hypothetical protein